MQLYINGNLTPFMDFKTADILMQRSTADIVLTGTLANAYTRGLPVVIYDEVNQYRVFAGNIDSAKMFMPNPALNVMIWTLKCVDNHRKVDKRVIAKAYSNALSGDIVGDMVTTTLAAEGLIATRAQPAYARASATYTTQGAQVASGVMRFEAPGGGQIGGMLEESCTNFLTANQSSWETNTTGATAINSATLTQDNAHAWNGTHSLKVVTPGSVGFEGVGVAVASSNFTANEFLTLSFWIYATSAINLTAFLWQQSPSVTIGSMNNFTTTANGWQRVTFTSQMPGSVVVTNYGIRIGTTAALASTWWIDGCQIEANLYPTSWALGGTPRAADTLDLPTAALINASEGSLAIAVYITQDLLSSPTDRYIFYTGNGSDQGRVSLRHIGGGNVWTYTLSDNTSGPNYTAISAKDTLTAVGWHIFGVRYNSTEASLWIDGTKVGVQLLPFIPTVLDTNIYIGSNRSLLLQPNTFFGGFQTTYYARSDASMNMQTDPGSVLAYDDDSSYIMTFNSVTTGQSTLFDGTSIISAVCNYAQANDAISAVAEKNDFYWLVDHHNVLKMGPYDARQAPFLVNGGALYGNQSVMLNDTIYLTNEAPLHRNTQYLLGGYDQTASQVETQYGDASKRTFALGYAVAMAPTIQVSRNGGAFGSVTVGIKGTDTGKAFYWSQNDFNVYQDPAQTVLAAVDRVRVTYVGYFPVVIYNQDNANVHQQLALEGAGTGIVELAELAPADATSAAASQQVASGKLKRYGPLAQVLEFETMIGGLKAGQLATVTCPEYGLLGAKFLIQQVDVSTPDRVNWRYKVTAIEGPASDTWTSFFNKTVSQATAISQLNIGQNSVLVIDVPQTETWTWTETVTKSVYTCPICGNSTLCGNSTIVC